MCKTDFQVKAYHKDILTGSAIITFDLCLWLLQCAPGFSLASWVNPSPFSTQLIFSQFNQTGLSSAHKRSSCIDNQMHLCTSAKTKSWKPCSRIFRLVLTLLLHDPTQVNYSMFFLAPSGVLLRVLLDGNCVRLGADVLELLFMLFLYNFLQM
jgi:hypothetical protein